MGLEALALGGEGDVDEVLLLQQVLEGRCEGQLVVVPFQTELVGHSEEDYHGHKIEIAILKL